MGQLLSRLLWISGYFCALLVGLMDLLQLLKARRTTVEMVEEKTASEHLRFQHELLNYFCSGTIRTVGVGVVLGHNSLECCDEGFLVHWASRSRI